MTTSIRKWTLLGVTLALAGMVGCGDDDGVDPGVDAGRDSGMPDSGTPDSDTPPPDGDTPPPDSGMPCEPETIMVSADITTDTTWRGCKTYILTAPIYVQDSVLTIEAGTEIRGMGGANALIITTSGRLEAEGTAENPIVFTSAMPEGSRAPGQWGGVVLLGEAPINVPGGTNNIEGLDPGEERGEYGGTDAAHDCGTLRYVRIEWAGFVFGTDNELNSLTLGGCGTGTTLEYIQTHGGSDDGIEFFGGTASIKHAIVTQTGDDGLDWDQGWVGDAQFIVIQQAPGVGDKGIEADGLEGNETATPRSNPRVYNLTIVGGGQMGQEGMRLRRGTFGTVANAIVSNFGMGDCIELETSETIRNANMGNLRVINSLVNGCVERSGMPSYVRLSPTEGDDVALTADWASLNRFGTDPMLPAAATNVTAPNFVPAAGSPAAMMAATVPSGGIFEAAAYVGAFAPGGANWLTGWTAYPVAAE